MMKDVSGSGFGEIRRGFGSYHVSVVTVSYSTGRV